MKFLSYFGEYKRHGYISYTFLFFIKLRERKHNSTNWNLQKEQKQNGKFQRRNERKSEASVRVAEESSENQKKEQEGSVSSNEKSEKGEV